jgi:NOL1/NOP2/sun family putative RNA methylase
LEFPAIPALFLENMRRLLGEQADAFQASYWQPPVAGLRVNTLKIASDDLRQRLPYHLKPLPWTQSGFRLAMAEDDPAQSPGSATTLPAPGKHVYHAAGLYYLQEPSAMAVAEMLNPGPGETVLDLCAAPGGKTTHLAALMDNQGVLVANEMHPKRVWELAENLERWGARNTIITNESPPRLAERLGGYFDKILVDAPCSGEGMFRKSESARRDWSPEHTVQCAQRQTAILDSAVQMLKPGGLLAYSTCTFNPLENESTLARFLKSHPDFEILPIDPISSCSPGQPGWVPPEDYLPELAHAIRIWPHLAPGEGHFVALLRRNSDQPATTVSLTRGSTSKARGKVRTSVKQSSGQMQPGGQMQPHMRTILRNQWLPEFQNFCQQNLQTTANLAEVDAGHLSLTGAYLYQLPANAPDLTGLKVIHPGWWLGAFYAGAGQARLRFEPAHALALGLRIEQAQRCLDLESGSPQVSAYLRGETLAYEGEAGWVLLAVDGFPLGWGKSGRGQVKNFYPRGLRRV